jgi:AraC-like DNA-binding protein
MPSVALDLLVGRCHGLAEQVAALPPLAVLQEVQGLAATIPLAPTLHEQLLGRALVTHLLGRLACVTGLDCDPDLARAFFAVTAASWADDSWFGAFAHAVRRFERALTYRNDLGSGRAPLDVRLHRAVAFIDAHFRDPRLTLAQVAHHAGLSRFYVARMLKNHTGAGFVGHLRRRRIEAAKELLAATVLSIKEIAAKVGYGTPRQFERDFKRLCGVAPTSGRRPDPSSNNGR